MHLVGFRLTIPASEHETIVVLYFKYSAATVTDLRLAFLLAFTFTALRQQLVTNNVL